MSDSDVSQIIHDFLADYPGFTPLSVIIGDFVNKGGLLIDFLGAIVVAGVGIEVGSQWRFGVFYGLVNSIVSVATLFVVL